MVYTKISRDRWPTFARDPIAIELLQRALIPDRTVVCLSSLCDLTGAAYGSLPLLVQTLGRRWQSKAVQLRTKALGLSFEVRYSVPQSLLFGFGFLPETLPVTAYIEMQVKGITSGQGLFISDWLNVLAKL